MEIPTDRPPGVKQTRADSEETAADTDQTGSDSDQTSADRDQAAADLDQRTADHDQDLSDGWLGSAGSEHEESRQARDATAAVREETSQRRAQVASLRDTTSLERDARAWERDLAATERDRRAAALDREIEDRERSRALEAANRTPTDNLLRADRDRRRAAADRCKAAERRAAAATDRELAALDREQAALDREQAARERNLASLDELTSTLRRGVGLAALDREMERTRRTGAPLVVAFVDVDGLKLVNDRDGHAAGDAVICRVAEVIRTHLRPYDLIVRVGGDEFLCVVSGARSADVRRRFDGVHGDLLTTAPPCSVTVGLAEFRPDESREELAARADADLLTARARALRTAS